jgi:ATP-dependent RNA helicase DeaD
MVSRFNNRGFSVVALSGELNQNQRSAALQALRDGRAQVCIATDVAARGLDLPDLELVIHADVPKNREALLHRSGRTGRAGRKGVSALIVPHKRVRYVERLLKSANVEARWTPPPSAEQVLARDNVRMLEGMVLADPISEEEREAVSKIIETYSPEHIAAAFVRQYRAGRSAPEELLDVPDEPSGGRDRGEKRERKPRQDFADGIWYSLNLGRKQRAEPRWILPMLSKSGDLKKHEIGAIKISERETFVEIAPSGLERFVKAIGPDGKIEKAITARRIDGKPDLTGRSGSAHEEFVDDHPPRKHRKGSSDKYKGDKKPWKKDAVSKPEAMKATKPKKAKKPFDAESYAKKKGRTYDPSDDAGHGLDPEQTTDNWSEDKFEKPQKDGKKKPHKKKLAKAAARKNSGRPEPVQGKKTGPKGGDHPPKRSGKKFDGGKGKPKFGGKPSGGKAGAKFKRKPRK